jgi:hypothetical protein
MEASETVNQLLKKKYDLHKSPEVEAAANRTKIRTGEKIPQDPAARIQNYLDRLSNIVNPPQLEGNSGFDKRERNLEMLKRGLQDQFIIKPGDISENYWENQRRIIRERGQGADLEQVDWQELKKQNTEAIIADQKSSLDKWINYLSSPDAPYSDALKYFTMRSILYMGEYDKEKKIYPQRSKGTTKPFPDLNREALAYVLSAVEKKYKGQNVDLSSLGTQDDQEFEKLLQGENFAKLYAWAIEKVTPASKEELSAAKGQWVKYKQGSDHMSLIQSLQGHGTGWCTAGESTAEIQLKGGDFYVYYSLDKDGKPTIPRAAIRMQGNNIGEVRGIAKEQNLDPYIGGVVEDKLRDFPDGELYQKKVSDMKLLTEIENKTKLRQNLTAQNLVFLYEINTAIDGFGFEKDPRIKELRSQRNPQEDMLVVFGCDKSQIANSIGEINKDTKAYVGALALGIFNAIGRYNIEYVYTSFPEGKIRRESIEIGGKSVSLLEQELKQANINTSERARDMLHSKGFTALSSLETLDMVRLKVADLGLPGRNPTTDQIYAKAKELGLELVPAETGAHYRLKNRDQKPYDELYMGMKRIPDRYGDPNVFRLNRFSDSLWLDHRWANPDCGWTPEDTFMFALRKSEPKKLGLLNRFLKR